MVVLSCTVGVLHCRMESYDFAQLAPGPNLLCTFSAVLLSFSAVSNWLHSIPAAIGSIGRVVTSTCTMAITTSQINMHS